MNLTTKKIIYVVIVLILFLFFVNSLTDTQNENSINFQNRPETGEISF